MGSLLTIIMIIILGLIIGIGNYPSLESFDEKYEYYKKYCEENSYYESNFGEWLNDFYDGALGQFSVRFEYPSSSEDKVISINKYYKLQEPTYREKMGYIFEGWYVGDSDVKWYFKNYVQENMTLKARYVHQSEYGIVYQKKDYYKYEIGVRISRDEIDFTNILPTANDKFILKDKNGKTLKSYKVKLEEGMNKYEIEYYLNLTKYSYQVIVKRFPMVTVSFNTNSLIEIPSVTIEGGTSITELPILEKEGYYFNGWDYTPDTPITDELVINAVLYSENEVLDLTKNH